MKIAIDGPAASGKSTLGAALAKRLGYLYFDTGVMYRAVTLAALLQRVDIGDPSAVLTIARMAQIEVNQPGNAKDDRQYTVLLDGDDVTWRLRQPDIDINVSIPSAYADVRDEMVRRQRRIAERGNVVMVGRDIGTVVLPNADLKIYLDATVEERARRRCKEMVERGQPAVYDQILEAMRHRDLLDSTRQASPLKPAEDALIIDSTHRSVEDILDELEPIIARIKEQLAETSC